MDFALRPWREDDLPYLVQWGNNRNISLFLRDGFPFPYTEDDGRAFLASLKNTGDDEPLSAIFAIDIQGIPVGSVGVFQKDDVYRKSAEIGYWLAQPYWGKGIMTAAVGKIIEYGFGRKDIMRLFAEPYANNPGSRRVLEKCGFRLEGTLRQNVYKDSQYLDSYIFGLLRTEYEAAISAN